MIQNDTIYISKINEVYLKIQAESGILQELNQHFCFEVPGAVFMPAFKRGYWNGKIYLFNLKNSTLYVGLLEELEIFAKNHEYSVENIGTYKDEKSPFSEESIHSYFNSIPLSTHGKSITIRDYQLDSATQCILDKRKVLLSATSSGKSSILYLLSRFHLDHQKDDVIIIVPNTSLVEQLYSDFQDYSELNGWNVESNVHQIYSGKEKISKKRIIITTWQSIYKENSSWFDRFGMVIVDECHMAQSKSLTSILEKMTNVPYRIATTGTLQDTKCHLLVIQGLFGPVKNVITTKELMDRKLISNLMINCILLQYPQEICKYAKDSGEYQAEYDFVINYKSRNNFIANLACKCPDNTLVLFKTIEHGKTLFELIKKKLEISKKDRKVFLIYGITEIEQREKIRKLCEIEKEVIIVASYGTFSTGISINELYDVIFASPNKSKIRNLQSIGRSLRKGTRGDIVRLHDIADNMQYKNRKNFGLKHYLYRISLYTEQELKFRQISVKI